MSVQTLAVRVRHGTSGVVIYSVRVFRGRLKRDEEQDSEHDHDRG